MTTGKKIEVHYAINSTEALLIANCIEDLGGEVFQIDSNSTDSPYGVYYKIDKNMEWMLFHKAIMDAIHSNSD